MTQETNRVPVRIDRNEYQIVFDVRRLYVWLHRDGSHCRIAYQEMCVTDPDDFIAWL